MFFGFTNFNSSIYFVLIFADEYCKASYIAHRYVTPSRQTLHGFLSLSNYFNKMNEEKPIYEAAYRLEGYFSKQSYQLVFLTLSLSFELLWNLSCTSLEPLSNLLPNLFRTSFEPDFCKQNKWQGYRHMQCLWSQQTNLEYFLFLLGLHPYENLGGGEYDFP